MLKGQELLNAVQLYTQQGMSRVDMCAACGYVVDGKAKYTAFYESIMEAKGIITAAVAEQQDEVIAEDSNNQETINELLEDYPAAAIEEFIEYFGEGQIDSFTDSYQGEMSGSEFAQQLVEDCYCLDVPGFVAIDWSYTWDNLRDDYVELEGYIFCLNF